jgi:hypothetical protein
LFKSYVVHTLKGLSEFAVHTDYADKKIAEQLMQYIKREANKAAINVAVAGAPGKLRDLSDRVGRHSFSMLTCSPSIR